MTQSKWLSSQLAALFILPIAITMRCNERLMNHKNVSLDFMSFYSACVLRLLLLSLLLTGCSETMDVQTSHVYPLTNGETVNLASPEKWVIINYWAIWCAPCRKEVPELNELMHLHQDRLQVIGVNFDGSEGEKLGSEVSKLDIEFANFTRDPRQVWGLDPVTVLPETLIIDKQGNLVHRLVGPQERADLEALVGLQNATDPI